MLVTIQPARRIYKIGKPIFATVRLTNTGSLPFYVRREVGQGYITYHDGFWIEIWNAAGKVAQTCGYAAGQLGGGFHKPVTEQTLREDYVQLRPSASIQLRFAAYCPPKTAGNYRLVGVYTAEFEETNRLAGALPEAPILTGKYDSRSVKIEIR